MSSVNNSSDASSGCTTASWPEFRASTWNSAPDPIAAAPAHQIGCFKGRRNLEAAARRPRPLLPSGVATARRCSTLAVALDRPDDSAKTTVSMFIRAT